MTAYARVITIGRNSAMPRTYTLPLGASIDGTAVTRHLTVEPDEIRCPDCKGWGCTRCDGGIIQIENPEAAGCLPVSGPGRSRDHGCTLGRLTSSGVQPVARAAGDLPCFVDRKTHTVLRSVPGPSASRRPAGEMPPNALSGTLANKIIDAVTVIAGLAVFSMIALFLLVLA